MKKSLLLASMILLVGCGTAVNNAPVLSQSTSFSQKSAVINPNQITEALENVQQVEGGAVYNFSKDPDPLKAAQKGLYRLESLMGSSIRSFTVLKKVQEDNSHGRFYRFTFAVKLNNGASRTVTVEVLREFYGDDFEDSHTYKAIDAIVR